MTATDIKKALYKENPKANLTVATRAGLTYFANLKTVAGENGLGDVIFVVPFDDIGDAKFYPEMDAKLLTRWLLL